VQAWGTGSEARRSKKIGALPGPTVSGDSPVVGMILHRLSPVASSAEPPQRPMPDWNDHELIAALERSDPRAGPVLYDRLIRIVEWTILRVTGERFTEHEDLVQGAFEQIVITLHRRRYAGSCSLTSWASALSCHIALNALRSRRRQRKLALENATLERTCTTDLEAQLDVQRALARVRAELASMPASRAEVLVLHEVNGLDLKEIAGVLGISVAAAQSRLSRGRRELSERLGRGGES
jgi:RNA polymerase sigma-70 factor, ECF subfamily